MSIKRYKRVEECSHPPTLVMFICHHLLSRFHLHEVQISASGHGNAFRHVNLRPKPIINVACRLVSIRPGTPFLRGTKQKIPVPPGRSAGAGEIEP